MLPEESAAVEARGRVRLASVASPPAQPQLHRQQLQPQRVLSESERVLTAQGEHLGHRLTKFESDAHEGCERAMQRQVVGDELWERIVVPPHRPSKRLPRRLKGSVAGRGGFGRGVAGGVTCGVAGRGAGRDT